MFCGEKTQQTDRISTSLYLPVIIAAASLEVTGVIFSHWSNWMSEKATAKQNRAEDCSLPHATEHHLVASASRGSWLLAFSGSAVVLLSDS